MDLTCSRRRRPVLVLGLSAALSLGLVACGDDDDDAAAPAATTAAGAASNETTASAAGPEGTAGSDAAPAAATEVIKQVSFTAKEVRVAVGGTVVFDNQDTQAHTATSDDGTFDTGSIAAGTNQSVDFPKAGTFAFHCSFHPFMTAQVVVA